MSTDATPGLSAAKTNFSKLPVPDKASVELLVTVKTPGLFSTTEIVQSSETVLSITNEL